MSEIEETSTILPNSENSSPDTPPVNMSRRKFLIKGAAALAATPLVLKSVELGLYEVISKALSSSESLNKVIETANTITESPETENGNYRPVAAMLDEAIQNYIHTSHNPVIYKKSKDYRDAEYYSDVIKEIRNKAISPTSSLEFKKKLTQNMPGEAFYAFAESDHRTGSFADIIAAAGSGFAERFQKNFPHLVDSKGRPNVGYFEEAEKMGKQEISEARLFVENETKQAGQPISAAKILEYFLNKNNGELDLSIYDTALFFKFTARNDFDTGTIRHDSQQIDWYKKHIKDEYQGPSFDTAQTDEDRINLIGKPYHTWNLTALLKFFPTEMVQVSGIYRQAVTFKDQGMAKSRGDLQTLEELPLIETKLQSY